MADSHLDVQDDIEYIDPIISSDLTSFIIPPSRSQPRKSPDYLTDRSKYTSGIQTQDEILPSSEVLLSTSESEPLLANNKSAGARKKPFYRPRPLWIVPFAIAASIIRGMTSAPRIEVFTQLSCEAVYSRPIDYNHTRSIDFFLDYRNRKSLTLNSESSATKSLQDNDASPIHSLSFIDDDNDEEDPMNIPTKRCNSDPAVQAGAARLQTMMTVTMGILSALTTGWWGHFSDRRGRTRVLMMSTLGLLLTDMTFILVSTPHSIFASHGHKLIIIAPIIEGLLGGWSTLQAATSAYVSDCTSPGSRSHIFSRFAGVYYLGFALGPMIGAFIIRNPPSLPFIPVSHGQSVAPVFWVAMMCSFVNFLLAAFVFPESLHKHKKLSSERQEVQQPLKISNDGKSFISGFVKPLMIFAPKIKQVPGRSPKREWTLTYLGLSVFIYYLSMGLFQLKYLYAKHVFEWGAEQLSYYISFMGSFRALTLLFFLPAIISAFKPKRPQQTASAATSSAQTSPKSLPTRAQLASEISFDLSLSKYSLVIDLCSHTLVSLSPTTQALAAQTAFVGFTSLSSIGSGLVPSAQSLALCIMQSEELSQGIDSQNLTGGTGSLFGAFSVMQATGQMILGPLLFGFIYSSTVATFPKAIFVVAASFVFVALILLLLIRSPSFPDLKGKNKRLQPDDDNDDDDDDERGRSKARKDLR